MAGEGSLQTNLLAVVGMVANPQGRLLYPKGGPLHLEWVFKAPSERVERGRELCDDESVSLDPKTLAGWFCLSSSQDEDGLTFLRKRQWQSAIKLWESLADERWAQHNLATLHRLLYLSGEDSNSYDHLISAFELYSYLEQYGDGYTYYAKWAEEELLSAFNAPDCSDEEVVAAFEVFAKAKGLAACEALQDKLMLRDLSEFRVRVAGVMKELLPFQGVADSPSGDLLENSQAFIASDTVPLARRLRSRLLPISSQYRQVGAQMAELCGLLSQSLLKAGQKSAADNWHIKAKFWDAGVAEKWKRPGGERLEDEPSASVVFPQAVEALAWKMPEQRGFWWLGVYGKRTDTSEGNREEWLHALRLMGLAIYPLRRFVIYRDLESKEIIRGEGFPLSFIDNLRQALAVILLSFISVAVVLGGRSILIKRGVFSPSSSLVKEVSSPELNEAQILARLKELAQTEAKILKSSHIDTGKLASIRAERLVLLEKIEKLKARPSR